MMMMVVNHHHDDDDTDKEEALYFFSKLSFSLSLSLTPRSILYLLFYLLMFY